MSSRVTRPGRGESTRTRSARTTASSTSWVTSRTVRGSRASAPASQACMSARVMASSAPKGSSRQRIGRLALRVRRNATRWRMPPRQLVGPRALEAAEAERGEERARLVAGLPAARAREAQRQRGVVERAEPGQQEVALGHEDRVARLHRSRVGRGQAADELQQRRLPAAAGPDDGDDLAGQRRAGRARRARRSAPVTAREGLGDARQPDLTLLHNIKRLLHRSLEPRDHRSLRGHYPTGSKGQRRTSSAISAGLPPAPLICVPRGYYADLLAISRQMLLDMADQHPRRACARREPPWARARCCRAAATIAACAVRGAATSWRG